MTQICLNKNFVLVLLALILLAFAYLLFWPRVVERQKIMVGIKDDDDDDIEEEDLVKLRDYVKVFDPLSQPTKRPSRDQIFPSYLKPMFDIHTKGMPDNFHQYGLLISTDQNENQNKIIKLFGRKEYPGSNNHEYYAMLNNGNDSIKFPLKNKKELFNGDEIVIDELGKTYKVKIYDNDSPKYYPDIF